MTRLVPRLPQSAAFALALLVGLVLTAPTARADDSGAVATVVHGVPGLEVDVYVNGANAIPGFLFGTVTDPIPLVAGDYDLAVLPAGGTFPDDAVLTASATLEDGDNVSIVAHLEADGTPALSIFANDLSLPASGEGRVVVRHLAAAPKVDVGLERRWYRWWYPVAKLEDVTNGDEASSDLHAARYRATIFPAGSDGCGRPAGSSAHPLRRGHHRLRSGRSARRHVPVADPESGTHGHHSRRLDRARRARSDRRRVRER